MRRIYAEQIIDKINNGKPVHLRKAEIIGDLDFTTIKKTKRARFSDNTYKSIVNNELEFRDCLFKGHVKTYYEKENRVYYTIFNKSIKFINCKFLDKIDFKCAQFLHLTSFKSSHFNSGVSFYQSKFFANVNFHDSYFFNETNFHDTKFYEYIDFEKTKFMKTVNFENTTFYSLKDDDKEPPLLEAGADI